MQLSSEHRRILKAVHEGRVERIWDGTERFHLHEGDSFALVEPTLIRELQVIEQLVPVPREGYLMWPQGGDRVKLALTKIGRSVLNLPHLEQHDYFSPVAGLLPCPHCGGPAEMRPVERGGWRIVCGCPWFVDSLETRSYEEVVSAWNRRCSAQEAVGH